ncbi:hypothetical protein EGW08_016610 [Elysia chlorotica]|uniref:Phosphatidylinositol-specific phospholipase C X domain-containing protein n=1 Tax=Elysia chlorotica TaxID=188477 RepID=A0A3S1B457_ELYCH|nr:hypothetical protein EGW08_016610 [Elysia chlorotica]
MVSPSTADWMGNLPERLRQLPLSQINIPGSHDTGSFRLDINGPVAPDASTAVRLISCLPGVKKIMKDWGITQSLDFKQQLEAGVRYFDLRVARNSNDQKLYLVHTLYGPMIEEVLTTVDTFLTEHSGEAILLDFNHFYSMEDEDHKFLLARLLSVFGARLCDVHYAVADMTLEKMASHGKQVIVFYQGEFSAPEKWTVATRASIRSPWPNTTDPAECLEYLKNTFARPWASDFIVCQGVLTPTVGTILADLCGSLHKLNSKLSPLLLPWLSGTTLRLNVVISDFVDEADFIGTVLQRNGEDQSNQQLIHG